jgi:hypothetical protein
MDNKIIVGTVMLDFSAAFDIIRRQRMLFNGSLSVNKDVLCGVPQGSCLYPLYFLSLPMTCPMFWNRQK